ncbi:MAG: hypothetical protein V4736_02540 [Bdellovibrionota bacterium]
MKRRDFLKKSFFGGIGASLFRGVGSALSASALLSSKASGWVGAQTRRAGRLVYILGLSNVAASTRDGVTWTARSMPSMPDSYPYEGWFPVIWGGSLFCTVSYRSNCAATTPDGINWTVSKLPLIADWTALGWNGTIFCAVAYNSDYAATSPDGLAWTQRTLPVSAKWNSIQAKGSVFALIGNDTRTLVSSDGISWTQGTMCSVDVNPAWDRICWNGTVFCATTNGTYNSLITSPDGITYTSRTIPYSGKIYTKVAAINGVICIASPNGGPGVLVIRSTDNGVTWADVTPPLTNPWNLEAANGNFFLFSNSAGTATQGYKSTDGLTWTEITLAAHASPWHGGIAWNGTVYCVVHGYSDVSNLGMTSPDGTTWTLRTLPASVRYSDIAWNGTVFAAIAYNSAVAASSADGITWFARALPSSSYWFQVEWNGASFCTNASTISTNKAATSPDGITWTARALPSTKVWGGIAWNGTVFCVLGTNGFATSANGSAWTARALPVITSDAGTWYGMTSNSSIYCAVANNTQTAATSTDGLTWTKNTLPAVRYWSDVAWNGTVFGAVTYQGFSASSTDGTTWTGGTFPASSSAEVVTALGSLFVGAADTDFIYTSPDAITWTARALPANNFSYLLGIAASPTTVLVTDQFYTEQCLTSTNGTAWTLRDPPEITTEDFYWSRVVWAKDRYIALSEYTGFATSKDGNTWTVFEGPFPAYDWYGAAWNGTLFCIIGGRYFATSADGITWTGGTHSGGSSVAVSDMIWNGTIFCAPTQLYTGSTKILTSSNGTAWTTRTAPNGVYYAIAWNGTVFCAVGGGVSGTTTNLCITSPDGITWTSQTMPTAGRRFGVAWNGAVFCVTNGFNDEVLTSPNGITWTTGTMTGSTGTYSLTWSGKVFIAADWADVTNNKVFTSPDGLNWTQQTLPVGNEWATVG